MKMREKKVEYLILEVVFKLPPHLDINNTSLLKYQHTCLYAAYCIYSHTKVGGGGVLDRPPLTCSLLTVSDLVGRKVM